MNLAAADELHVLQQRTLQNLEDHDAAAGDFLPVGLHVDKLMRVIEPAHVFRDQLQVERPAGPRANVRQDLFQRQRLVARNLHVDDHVGRRSGGQRIAGRGTGGAGGWTGRRRFEAAGAGAANSGPPWATASEASTRGRRRTSVSHKRSSQDRRFVDRVALQVGHPWPFPLWLNTVSMVLLRLLRQTAQGVLSAVR